MMHSLDDFPPLKNDRVLKVAIGEKPDKLPIWIMRQAGRHMEEFRTFCKAHGLIEIYRTPELACEVTLMPIKRYNLDAAIIFSDILAIPQALGLTVEMSSEGPVLRKVLTVETIDDLKVNDAIDRLSHVGKAINLARHRLEGEVPLFGFSGAPWSLMGYMIEGGASKMFSTSKIWLYTHPDESHQLLNLLTDVIIDFLVMQVEAGAQILQIFESNANCLTDSLIEEFCAPYLKRIQIEVKKKLREKCLPVVPMVVFVRGAHNMLQDLEHLGYDVVGIDWIIPPKYARTIMGPNAVIQGNLDPCALFASHDDIRTLVDEMINDFGSRNYIVNLGHGIYADTDEQAVEVLIDAVHNHEL